MMPFPAYNSLRHENLGQLVAFVQSLDGKCEPAPPLTYNTGKLPLVLREASAMLIRHRRRWTFLKDAAKTSGYRVGSVYGMQR